MKKRLKWLFFIVVLFCCLANSVWATEPVKDNTVYVAGNPDLYPFEYYDARSDSYLGIMPELYAQISKNTGLDFVYLSPGMVNQQSRLAKNSQVELVSAYVRGQVETIDQEVVLLRYGGDTEICIGFTAITPQWMKDSIYSSLTNITEKQLLEMALEVPERLPEQKLYWRAAIIGSILLLAVAVLSAVLLRLKIKERKKKETRFIDQLTGIGNTAYFEKTFRHCVTQPTYALYYVGYIALEIQRVEQYLGILETKELQRYAADILSQEAADGDFAARIDEGVFLLAFQAPSENSAAIRIAEILNRLNSYGEGCLEEYGTLFKAGVFWVNAANLSIETVVFNARQGYNVAAYEKQDYIFADKKTLNREATKIELRRQLSDALEKREFQLYMQMIVNRNGEIVGAEALSRWQNREKGILSPAAYIEPLKAAGFMDKLDFSILEEVCKQLEQWAVDEKSHLWISCNFTRMTVSRNDFIDRFREIVERYRFDRKRLVLELTEDSLMDNTAVAYRNILECKNMGCLIALDDLGSGYSSLQDLCDYPIDMIKIDRHIMLKSTTPRGFALLQGLTKMCHDLGMKVLCEGVENELDNKYACDAECDYIQGYYYSRVLPRDEANLFYMRKQKQQ